LIEPRSASISERRQCELVGLSRASFYFEPQLVAKGPASMRLLDEQ
jgi:hypothetical protein